MTAYAVESARDGRRRTVCALCLSSAEVDAPDGDVTIRDRRTGARVRRLPPAERVGRSCDGCGARLATPLEHGYPCWRCGVLFDPLTTTGSVYCSDCHPIYLELRAQRAAERTDRLAHANDRLTP